MNTTRGTLSTTVPVICGECGQGNFETAQTTRDLADFHCTHCGTEVNWCDLGDMLEDGQRMVVSGDFLHVTTRKDGK